MFRGVLRKAKAFVLWLSPRLGVQILYMRNYGRFFSWKNPQLLTEKIQVLKVGEYNRHPIYTRCADKYLVRGYLAEKGLAEMLVPLIGVYDGVDEICFDLLPNAFVLKWNFGNGYNIVCTDKSKLDIPAVVKKMKRWGRESQHLKTGEMQYKRIPQKIVCEALVEPQNGLTSLVDIKFHCIAGVPVYGFIVYDRFKNGQPKMYSIDSSFTHTNSELDPSFEQVQESPILITDRLKADVLAGVQSLSKDFKYVRVDLMFDGTRLYFSELTFSSGGGLDKLRPEVDMEMGRMLNLK